MLYKILITLETNINSKPLLCTNFYLLLLCYYVAVQRKRKPYQPGHGARQTLSMHWQATLIAHNMYRPQATIKYCGAYCSTKYKRAAALIMATIHLQNIR